MHHQPVRQTFGLRNAKSPPPPPASTRSQAKSGGGGVSIPPIVLAGGMAFVIAVATVLLLGGSPPTQPGRPPQITELPSGNAQVKPQTPAPAAGASQPSGGKFGAATGAIGGPNR
jgi:hypothetical protein